ncbi:hypothetical protein [Pseudoalteromonas spongiae]|uniref:hypothetical protein n=1 Tax=Pseudoalteromonas spongiae TaxID=298657 RepID=UPI000C2D4948|nr:hypothetical protein [Pseudoalteromonas spongiae]
MKKITLWFIGILFVACALGGISFYFYNAHIQQQNAAAEKKRAEDIKRYLEELRTYSGIHEECNSVFSTNKVANFAASKFNTDKIEISYPTTADRLKGDGFKTCIALVTEVVNDPTTSPQRQYAIYILNDQTFKVALVDEISKPLNVNNREIRIDRGKSVFDTAFESANDSIFESDSLNYEDSFYIIRNSTKYVSVGIEYEESPKN